VDTFAGSERSAEEEDRIRRSVAEKVVKAGAAESFLAKAKKELPPDEWERVRESVVEAEGWSQAPDGHWYPPPPPPPPRNRGLGLGAAACVVETLSWIILVSAYLSHSWGWVFLSIFVGAPLGGLLGLIAIGSSAGRQQRRGRVLGGVAIGMTAAAGLALLVLNVGLMANDPVLNAPKFNADFGGASTTVVPVRVPFGQHVTRFNGDTVTVYGIVSPVQPDPDLAASPDSGMVFVAIDVEYCATKQAAQEVHAYWFTLEAPGNAWRPATPVKEPVFPALQSLALGACSRGWISFQVPEANSQNLGVIFAVVLTYVAEDFRWS